MPRPRKYSSHKLEAYGLYQQVKAKGEDVSALDIQVELEVLHPGGTASYRLIADWVREFKQQDEWQSLLDSPFQWHRMEEYGLPVESSRAILDLCRCAYETRIGAERFRLMGTPTVRQTRWWWRVHVAAKEIKDPIDLILLAQRFVSRELAHDVLGVPLELADLDALLIYRPWFSDEYHEVYLRAVSENRIPPLHFDPEQVALNAEKASEAQGLAKEGMLSSITIDRFAEGVNPECPELLFSQQSERWLKKFMYL
jgi:hypothetical protein